MDTIAYLDEAATAAVHIALDYIRRLLELLDLRPGHRVADLDCGPGTDLAALAAAVAPATVTGRGFARFTAGRVRNATIGRDLVRLATRAGFRVRDVQAVPVVFREAAQADRILGPTRNTARAVEAGRLRDEVAGPWLSRLTTAPFLASFTLYLITATHP